MQVAATDTAARSASSRWSLAYGWLAGLAAYCVAIFFADEREAAWINDLGWTLASAAATIACFRAARLVEPSRRKAWWLFGIGCTSWLIGQLHWNYSQLILRVDLPFPSIGQLFFSLFAPFTVAAVLMLPESRQKTPFTLKHVGNLGLVLCCLAVTIVLGLLEPALQLNVPGSFLIIALVHTLLVATTFLTALYALWTYRWSASWTAMLLVVLATLIYAIANLFYAHSLITGSYLPGDLINASWLVMFGLIAAAAIDQTRAERLLRSDLPQRMQSRERWLEAVVPALLIVIMVLVAVGSEAILTPRVMAWGAGLFIVFAIILGAREAWIQKESQELADARLLANEQLQLANTELRLSEQRYRELATALEQRVADRTTELKRAYDELEGFSYAVAHDLKAPLRAINGFAHLFEAEMDDKLSDRARDHLFRIRNGALKMATLIDDLLSYSQIDRRGLQSTIVRLETLVDSIVAHYADEVQKRRVALAVEVEWMTLHVDAEGLSLALRNLFENALKYTRQREQPKIEIRGRKTDTGVQISVCDNGIGFDMEYHDHIFKIFQRLHRDDQYPGTGIGLALVRKAIERMGGRVWAQSRAGEGSTFYIELPKSVTS